MNDEDTCRSLGIVGDENLCDVISANSPVFALISFVRDPGKERPCVYFCHSCEARSDRVFIFRHFIFRHPFLLSMNLRWNPSIGN